MDVSTAIAPPSRRNTNQSSSPIAFGLEHACDRLNGIYRYTRAQMPFGSRLQQPLLPFGVRIRTLR